MTNKAHEQSAAGIIPDADPKTFAEVLAKINASDAFLEALTQQPDETPIINLNFICCRPRGNATQYEAYGSVAGKEINGVGGSIAGYAVGITDADPDYHLSDKWDVVDLPVYPRRTSYLELQQSPAYQLAIQDRVGGTYERLLYVLSDDTDSKPFFDGTTSIAELHKTKKALPVKTAYPAKDCEVWVYELLRFKQPGGRDAFHRYAKAFQPILAKAGGKVWMSVRAEMPIVCEKFWDHFTVTQFPSLQALEDMFQSDAWQEVNADRLQAVDEMLAVAAKPVDLSAA
ncbi:MAG: DUF1330 domain-containing protein [Thermoanaerobaculia bacterium]